MLKALVMISPPSCALNDLTQSRKAATRRVPFAFKRLFDLRSWHEYSMIYVLIPKLYRDSLVRFNCYFLSCATAVLLSATAHAATQGDETSAPKGDHAPISFEADRLTHDQDMNIMTASGNVELSQNGRLLRADNVQYNRSTDMATATGNVVISEPNGDVYFADSASLSRDMARGLIQQLRVEMADGSRLWSHEANRSSAEQTEMKGAVYTACAPCKDNPNKTPPWQLKAKNVTLNHKEKTITYRHARLEVAGVPVFYTPYFSHPDGSVERKSGFLTPDLGWTSELGGFFEGRYYYDIAPNTDATIGLMATTQEGPVLKTNLRHRFDTARLEINSSLTHSGRVDSSSGEPVAIKEELRGHLFADLDWSINRKWRAGLDINLASDEQYLNQYDISGSDILENEIFLERLSGRNFADLRLMAFQDLRTGEVSNTDQPDILPTAEFRLFGDPNSTLGGRWGLSGSFLNLFRDTNGQDVMRASAKAEWERRMITPFGLVTTADASLRGDLYRTSDRTVAQTNPNESNSETDYRIIPSLHLKSEYPLAKRLRYAHLKVTPISSITLTSDVDNDNSIPNEDSTDVQLDALSLFESDRFPGIDRVEDRSHVSYGVRAGIYGDNGDHADILIGQSYRLHNKDNPFDNGSGLENQESDIVGQITAGVNAVVDMDLNYRFQMDGQTFIANRHEAELDITYGPVRFNPQYLYARGIRGSDFEDSREQVSAVASIDLNDEWRLNGYGKYDLGVDEGLLQGGIGLDYTGQCYTVSAGAVRNLTDRSSGNSETSILFRVGLKNLGKVENSDFDLFDYE